mmetsp:Transcript_15678/g.37240  ORF Transcript_15678/g.37240 Transcript_15678/m.37240 type:complete len:201 (+) Transcript_15678:287-889(+)
MRTRLTRRPLPPIPFRGRLEPSERGEVRHVKVGQLLLARGLQILQGRHAGQREDCPQAALLPQRDVGVEAVAHDADPASVLQTVVLAEPWKQPGASLPNRHRFPARRRLYGGADCPGAGHDAAAADLVAMVPVGEDEAAPRELPQACRGVGELAVAEARVKAHNHRADARVDLDGLNVRWRAHVREEVGLPADVRDPRLV